MDLHHALFDFGRLWKAAMADTLLYTNIFCKGW